ncbi:MAG: SDR family NAD(P)-dependent oxidoreductase [Minisyncoccales bacterium]
MKKFAFLIHPRLSAKDDMGRVNPVFRLFPETVLEFIIKFLPPIVSSKIVIEGSSEVEGYIIVVPFTGKQFYTLPRATVLNKLKQAIKKAKQLGVTVVGLGEFTSTISHGGLDLIADVGVTITNGNSLTAGITVESVRKIIKDNGLSKEGVTIGIVGAAGSIGSAVTKMFVADGFDVIVNDKKKERLQEMIASIGRAASKKIKIVADLNSFNEADIVVVASSAIESLIKESYLKKGAIIYDITQPRNISPEILKQRPDVKIIDGGIIDTPQIDYGMDIGLRPRQAFACLSETIIFALEGRMENSVGFVDLAKAEEMIILMKRYPYFKINFYSFGKPLK